jgi:hypothetical protein
MEARENPSAGPGEADMEFRFSDERAGGEALRREGEGAFSDFVQALPGMAAEVLSGMRDTVRQSGQLMPDGAYELSAAVDQNAGGTSSDLRGWSVRSGFRGTFRLTTDGTLSFTGVYSLSASRRRLISPQGEVVRAIVGFLGTDAEIGPSAVFQVEGSVGVSLSIDVTDSLVSTTFQGGFGFRLGVDVGLGVSGTDGTGVGAFARVGVGVLGRASVRGSVSHRDGLVRGSYGLSLRAYSQHEEGFDLGGGWRLSQRHRLSVDAWEHVERDTSLREDTQGGL